MRIIFMGTPDFATGILKAILEEKRHEVAAVVTAVDKAAGRGMKMQSSSVKMYAVEQHLPVLQPEKLRDAHFIQTLQSFKADIFVVVAFRMLPHSVWQMPPKGTINLHASLLPQYRGAAPINWAIINGEKQTGVTTFFINENIDEGNILLSETTTVSDDDDAGSLHDKLLHIGKKIVLETLHKIENNTAEETKQIIPQGELLKNAPKLQKENCLIDWNKSAEEISFFIRGLSPYPGAFSRYKTNEGNESILKIFSADFTVEKHHFKPGIIITDNKKIMRISCGNGLVSVKNLQLFGKRRMTIHEFLLGNKHFDGVQLF